MFRSALGSHVFCLGLWRIEWKAVVAFCLFELGAPLLSRLQPTVVYGESKQSSQGGLSHVSVSGGVCASLINDLLGPISDSIDPPVIRIDERKPIAGTVVRAFLYADAE